MHFLVRLHDLRTVFMRSLTQKLLKNLLSLSKQCEVTCGDFEIICILHRELFLLFVPTIYRKLAFYRKKQLLFFCFFNCRNLSNVNYGVRGF